VNATTCASCLNKIGWSRRELVNNDGTPHRLSCPSTKPTHQLTRRQHCPHCKHPTTFRITADRFGELQTCSLCSLSWSLTPCTREAEPRTYTRNPFNRYFATRPA